MQLVKVLLSSKVSCVVIRNVVSIEDLFNSEVLGSASSRGQIIIPDNSLNDEYIAKSKGNPIQSGNELNRTFIAYKGHIDAGLSSAKILILVDNRG